MSLCSASLLLHCSQHAHVLPCPLHTLMHFVSVMNGMNGGISLRTLLAPHLALLCTMRMPCPTQHTHPHTCAHPHTVMCMLMQKNPYVHTAYQCNALLPVAVLTATCLTLGMVLDGTVPHQVRVARQASEPLRCVNHCACCPTFY